MFSSTDSGGSWPGPASVFDIRESLMELNPRLARWAEEGWVGALFLFRKKCPSPRPTPPNEKLVGGVGGKKLCRRERRALARNTLHQFGPRIDERFRAIDLQLVRERVNIDAGLRVACEQRFGFVAIRRHHAADDTALRERKQGLLRHRVDRIGRGKRFDVEVRRQ